jgi:hypothetical protein
MSLFRNLASATFKDDGTKDLADFVSIMVSTAFMLANCRLCVSFIFAASLRKGNVETNKAEVLALIGVLSSLAEGEGEEIHDLYWWKV